MGIRKVVCIAVTLLVLGHVASRAEAQPKGGRGSTVTLPKDDYLGQLMRPNPREQASQRHLIKRTQAPMKDEAFFRKADVSGIRLGMTKEEATALIQPPPSSHEGGSCGPYSSCYTTGNPRAYLILFPAESSTGKAEHRVVEIQKFGELTQCKELQAALVAKYGEPTYEFSRAEAPSRYTLLWTHADDSSSGQKVDPLESCLRGDQVVGDRRCERRDFLTAEVAKPSDQPGLCKYTLILRGGRSVLGAQRDMQTRQQGEARKKRLDDERAKAERTKPSL